MLGNEAIVRGAIESGVQFISTYPGTPASEIGNTFFKIKNSKGPFSKNFYFEFSTNEKTAMEAGIGASFSGLKTLVAMKSFGLNVALEPLLPFLYIGSKGPAVIVVSDDPSCHSSAQSEENTRAISYLSHIPTLEPSDPQECKDFIKLGFRLSEKLNLPILIRLTTRVSHQRMPVKLGGIATPKTFCGNFIKEPKKFITMPPRVLEMKKELLEKIEKIKNLAEEKNIIDCEPRKSKKKKSDKCGIIVSGVSYLYVMEALERLNISLPILKIGLFYPLATQKINNFIKDLKKVLVVEELEPYLEQEIEQGNFREDLCECQLVVYS